MPEREQLTRLRRRRTARLDRLKRRIALVSALSFAVLFGLASQHAVGSSKRRTLGSVRHRSRAAPKQVRFFDEGGDGFAFAAPAPATTPAQGSAAPASPPQAQGSAAPVPAPQPPPPVAQTTVS